MIVPPAEHEGSSALSGLLASPKSPALTAEAPTAPIQFRRVILVFFMFGFPFCSQTAFFIMDSWWVQCVFEILETILGCVQNGCRRLKNVFERELHLPHISTGCGNLPELRTGKRCARVAPPGWLRALNTSQRNCRS